MAKDTSTAGLTADERDERLAAAPPAKGASGVLVNIRVLPKGAGEIFTGEVQDGFEHTKHSKGAIVKGLDLTIAQELEDRGMAEILDDEDLARFEKA